MCANLAILASLKLRFRINHSTHFAERQNHINGIENFWNQAKRHLRKFNGIPKAHFE
ncbi:DDE transposase, partial [Neisseria meningitidis]